VRNEEKRDLGSKWQEDSRAIGERGIVYVDEQGRRHRLTPDGRDTILPEAPNVKPS